MKCPECGKEVEVNVKVCPNCGYPFEEENIQEDNTQHDNITEKESPNSIESGNIEKKKTQILNMQNKYRKLKQVV